MIHSVMIFNAAGKPRLTKFYTPHPPSDRLAHVQRIYELLSSRPDSLCNFVELPRAELDFERGQTRSSRTRRSGRAKARLGRPADRVGGSKGKGKGKAKAQAQAQYEEYDEYEEERRQGGQGQGQAVGSRSRAGYSDIGGAGAGGGSSGTDDDDDNYGEYDEVDADTLDEPDDGDGAPDAGEGEEGAEEVLRVIYRHYATLYFVFCVDEAESELGILDLIQVFVESLDRCFENVCELDLIFNYDSVQTLLNCLIVGGYVQDTAIDSIASLFRQQMAARKASVQSDSLTAGLPEINLASLSLNGATAGMGGAAGMMGGVGSWTDRLTRGLGRGRLGR